MNLLRLAALVLVVGPTLAWSSVLLDGPGPSDRPTIIDPKYRGRWELRSADGTISSYLTVTDSLARRDHSTAGGRSSSDERRLSMRWDDGFHDELRQEPDGSMSFVALDARGHERFKLMAVKR